MFLMRVLLLNNVVVRRKERYLAITSKTSIITRREMKTKGG